MLTWGKVIHINKIGRSYRSLIRCWTRINKVCHLKLEKQQSVPWDSSYTTTSLVQIVVSGPTSTNCVIPNLPRGPRQLYQSRCHRFPLWWWYFTGVQKKKVVAKSWLLVISKTLDKANSWTIYRSTVLSTGAPQKLKHAAQSWEVRVISPSLGTTNNQSVAINHHLLPPPIPPTLQSTFPPFLPHPPPHQTDYHKH